MRLPDRVKRCRRADQAHLPQKSVSWHACQWPMMRSCSSSSAAHQSIHRRPVHPDTHALTSFVIMIIIKAGGLRRHSIRRSDGQTGQAAAPRAARHIHPSTGSPSIPDTASDGQTGPRAHGGAVLPLLAATGRPACRQRRAGPRPSQSHSSFPGLPQAVAAAATV